MTIDHFTVYSFFDYAPQAILNSAGGAVEHEKVVLIYQTNIDGLVGRGIPHPTFIQCFIQ